MALKDAWAVKVDGAANEVTDVEVSGSSVNLKVKDMIDFGDTIEVSYTKPDTTPITDLFGNELESFVDKDVDNEVLDPDDSDPPMFDGASTDKEGFEISISFDEDVVAAIPPPAVTQLNELSSGEDTSNQYKYFIEWRWSPGIATADNEHQYYQYRYRKVTVPESSWSGYNRVNVGSVVIGNLDPNSTFEIGVIGTNVGGDSPEQTDTADTPTVVAGTQPQNFRVTNKGRKLVNSSYQFFIDCAYERDPNDSQPLVRYEYRFKLATASDYGGWTDNGTNLTFTLENVTDDVAIDIQVRMVTIIGASIVAELQDTVHFAPPPAPDNFITTPSRGGDKTNGWTYQIALAWAEPTHDDTNEIDNYRYRFKLNSASNFGSWVSVSSTTFAATITGLTHTVGYDIELEAVNHEGESPKQTATNVIIFSKPPAVSMVASVVSKVDVMGTATNQIAWAWEVPVSDASNMIDDIQVRTRNKTGAWGNFVSKGAAGAQHQLRGLADGNTYQITIRTSNSAGNTDVINEVEFNVLAKAPFPEINVFTSIIYATSIQGIPLPDTKFVEYEYRANSSSAWQPCAPNGPRASPAYYVAVPSNFGEFDFVARNFEFSGWVRGTSQMRFRGVGAAPTYKPLTEWAVLTFPAAT